MGILPRGHVIAMTRYALEPRDNVTNKLLDITHTLWDGHMDQQ